MQATTTPKLANGHSALQAGLAAILVASAIAVGATVGIGLAQGAITIPAPAPVVGDYEASGVRRTAPINETRDRGLDGAAFRKVPSMLPYAGSVAIGGQVLWLGTDPTSPADRAGSFLKDADARHGGAFDQMSTFNNLGRSDAEGNTQKVGRAHR